jgi:hypothetical protein
MSSFSLSISTGTLKSLGVKNTIEDLGSKATLLRHQNAAVACPERGEV